MRETPRRLSATRKLLRSSKRGLKAEASRLKLLKALAGRPGAPFENCLTANRKLFDLFRRMPFRRTVSMFQSSRAGSSKAYLDGLQRSPCQSNRAYLVGFAVEPLPCGNTSSRSTARCNKSGRRRTNEMGEGELEPADTKLVCWSFQNLQRFLRNQIEVGEPLLLVFYLLVDKSNKPIIVDQPEEVCRLLIPVIKDVKKRLRLSW